MDTKIVEPKDDEPCQGFIRITSDRANYYAGDLVTGKIYLDIRKSYSNVQLILCFEGTEAAYVVEEFADSYGQVQNLLNSDKRTFLRQKACVYSWETISSSHYIIPYTFLLPSTLSASFFQETYCYSCYIRYKLKISLQTNNKLIEKFNDEHILIIRDRPKLLLQAVSEEIRTDLTTCCFFSAGSNTLRANFEKNTFEPLETARVVVEFDNSEGKLGNLEIQFSLKQNLRLLTGCSIVRKSEILAEQIQRGPQAGDSTKCYHLNVTIPFFRGDEHDLDKRTNHWPSGSNREIGPTTRSKFISSEYVLEVRCLMKARCINKAPKITCPIQINCPDAPNSQIELSEDWNPCYISPIKVIFQSKELSKKKRSIYPIKQTNLEMIKNEMIQEKSQD